jgi:hypothetical protein
MYSSGSCLAQGRATCTADRPIVRSRVSSGQSVHVFGAPHLEARATDPKVETAETGEVPAPEAHTFRSKALRVKVGG